MNFNEDSTSRRGLFRSLAQELSQTLTQAREAFDGEESSQDFFACYENCHTLVTAYPKELFQEEAARLGIDIEVIGIQEAVKRIVEQRASDEKPRRHQVSGPEEKSIAVSLEPPGR